jgi:hypothetical protein
MHAPTDEDERKFAMLDFEKSVRHDGAGMPISQEFKNKRYELLRSIARKRDGTILDRAYTDLHKSMNVRCQRGHRFKIKPKNLMRGMWCPTCRPMARQSEFLSLAIKVANKHGGKCTSQEYITARQPLDWKCKQGHRWQATFDNVANKESWCPTCAMAGGSERKIKWWRSQRSKRKRH